MNYKKIIQKHIEGKSACVQIHSNNYSSTFEHISQMVNELKKDFPFLEDKDIQVHKYGGERIKNITFVEAFFDRKNEIPKEYEQVKNIEYIL